MNTAAVKKRTGQWSTLWVELLDKLFSEKNRIQGQSIVNEHAHLFWSLFTISEFRIYTSVLEQRLFLCYALVPSQNRCYFHAPLPWTECALASNCPCLIFFRGIQKYVVVFKGLELFVPSWGELKESLTWDGPSLVTNTLGSLKAQHLSSGRGYVGMHGSVPWGVMAELPWGDLSPASQPYLFFLPPLSAFPPSFTSLLGSASYVQCCHLNQDLILGTVIKTLLSSHVFIFSLSYLTCRGLIMC